MKTFFSALIGIFGVVAAAAEAKPRPNILWITSEDNGPEIGAYGDAYADTPHLDQLAARGLRYLHAWSTAPVCAPARTAIISGMYPSSTGAEHMRSMTRLPDGMKMFPQYLREAGYYCVNNSKEDYNLEKRGAVWDESSNLAHWKNRGAGRPFFAVLNDTRSHESQIRTRPHTLKRDPAKAPVPSYHPDTPEVRRDWAQYYDKITEMDGQVGEKLRELEEAGLADETIIFYYGDHGSGMPRSKRWCYNSGLGVPLIVYIPEKFRHLAPDDYVAGGATDRLVSFVDLAPTVLSLAGIQPPPHMQGHAFMGTHAAPPQSYLHGLRGRMDERYDMVRAARDERYLYIRNYMPHKIYGQHLDYMFQTPTTRIWKRLYDEGKLRPPRTYFWEPKPPEELYDLERDKDEVNNLAGSSAHREILERLRRAQREFALQTRDVGFLPESELHHRAPGLVPYEIGREAGIYPLEKILATAELASNFDAEAGPRLKLALKDSDSAVRYWGALGMLMRGEKGVAEGRSELEQALSDASPSVRIVAAQALGQYGGETDLDRELDVLMKHASLAGNDLFTCLLALNAIDDLGGKARSRLEEIRALPAETSGIHPRERGYVPRLLEKIVSDLEGE